jgi:hypothetical protein
MKFPRPRRSFLWWWLGWGLAGRAYLYFIGRRDRCRRQIFLAALGFLRCARAPISLLMIWPAATARDHPNSAGKERGPERGHGGGNGQLRRRRRVAGREERKKVGAANREASVGTAAPSALSIWALGEAAAREGGRRRGIRVVVTLETTNLTCGSHQSVRGRGGNRCVPAGPVGGPCRRENEKGGGPRGGREGN